MSSSDDDVLLEVFADILCPWCYIGKRRLEAALRLLANEGRDRITVVWRSFELGQESRVPGPTAAELLASMWGSRARARAEAIRGLGKAEGLTLDLHRARPVNTFDAHRLTHLAGAHGLAAETAERLLYAYHTQGRNIADPETLAELGADVGLDPTAVRNTLASDAYAADVRADEARAARLGVTGVPSLVVGGRLAVSGVQSPEDLKHVIERAFPGATGPLRRLTGAR
jgi:predicted DsbA family dithiol-disulfide isomerase